MNTIELFRQKSYTDIVYMTTSPNGRILRVPGLLRGESTGQLWIPLTKASDTGLWCFLWYVSEQTVNFGPAELPIIP